jgi:hypothetical protein
MPPAAAAGPRRDRLRLRPKRTWPFIPRPSEEVPVPAFNPAAVEWTDKEKMPVFGRVPNRTHYRLVPAVRSRS